MIVTLKIKLGTYWSCDIELEDSSTLEDVHFAIQRAVDFDNDHLYEFFVSRTERSRDRTVYDDENGKLFDTVIRDIFPLDRDRRLFYLFDYGDSWIFCVSRTRKSPHEAIDGIKYPRVVKETGERPIQYDFEDEDEYDDEQEED
ncbi:MULTISPECIES: IS1096 element passenger TnpR family protein [Rhodopirellula]|uniref:IS1096 element passenger TnpR family protein n=1 Tax=Rhodopirellula sp. MGV TaxID=2023130 RepID=UPI000B976798|nr:hypothetical protein CGZ80_14835 [Rhodopirellula sp. MGV]PNY35261.1 hypothetical protein C2E31_19150 [Rhodopirellula baltica]